MASDQQTIIVDVVFRSASGRSILDKPAAQQDRLEMYASTADTRDKAVSALQELGFQIVGPVSEYGVTITGSPELIKEVFGEGELKVPATLSSWIASVSIPRPGEFY